MLSEEEREHVRLGALAKELKEHSGWSAYLAAVGDLRRVYLPQALARGDSDFEKGAIFAIDLVLTCLDATIERREELLSREAKLRQTRHSADDESDESENEARESTP